MLIYHHTDIIIMLAHTITLADIITLLQRISRLFL